VISQICVVVKILPSVAKALLGLFCYTYTYVQSPHIALSSYC